MAYVITSACIEEKAGKCLSVCPVDAIDYDEKQFYINPETCIDCQACVTVCPVDAIYIDSLIPEDQKKFIQINADFFLKKG